MLIIQRHFKFILLVVCIIGSGTLLFIHAQLHTEENGDISQGQISSFASMKNRLSSCDFYLNHMTDKELGSGKIEMLTFSSIPTTAIAPIQSLGVYVLVKEKNHLILVGRRADMSAVKELGYPYRRPKNSDFTLRVMRIVIVNAKSHTIVENLMLDPTVTPNGPCSQNICEGVFFDLAIQCLDELGYELRPINNNDQYLINDLLVR